MVANQFQNIEEMAVVNSEIRFITLELMKIASREKKPFDKVLREFKANAFKAKAMLARPRG